MHAIGTVFTHVIERHQQNEYSPEKNRQQRCKIIQDQYMFICMQQIFRDGQGNFCQQVLLFIMDRKSQVI